MDKKIRDFPKRQEGSVVGGTQAIARAASLLRGIAGSGASGNSLVELASRTELERPTAYRILQRLVAEGLVEQDPASRGYALGPLLYELGLAARPPRQLFSQASAVVARLAKESGDTVFAIIQSGFDSVCIDRKEGDYPVKALMMDPGRRRPMGIGAGSLALLSAMQQSTAEQLLDSNATRIQGAGEAQLGALQEVVRQGRADGYVLRAATEVPEILSLAIAVCNPYGTPLCAFSISALKFRIEHRVEFLLSLLRDSKHQFEAGVWDLH